MTEIICRDQAMARPSTVALILSWQDGVPCTVRDLITERVRCEFEKTFADHALVQLSDLGEAQVGKLVERALIGFAKRAFLLVIDGRQVVDLDTTIRLQPCTEVTFIRLVQLVGG